jgi:hypothetical protein
LHLAIPRVLCPRCGTQLRLSLVEPEPHHAITFQCDCGFEYKMPAARVQETL